MNKFKTLVIFTFILLIFGANVHANDLGNRKAGYYGPIDSILVNAYGVVWVKLPSGYTYNGTPYLLALSTIGMKYDKQINWNETFLNFYSSLLSLLLTAQATHQNVHLYIPQSSGFFFGGDIPIEFRLSQLPLNNQNVYYNYGVITDCNLGKCDFWPVDNY